MAIFYDNSTNVESNIINVKSFGAKGDGITNDATSIQAAIDDVNSSGTLHFPLGTYIIGTSLSFNTMSNFIVDLGGSTLQAIDNMGIATSGKVINFTTCSNFILKDGTIDGNRDSRGIFTVSTGTDIFTSTNHGTANDLIVQVLTTDTLPVPLSGVTNYYVINSTANSYQLALSLSGSAIDITTTGTGTHYMRRQVGAHNSQISSCDNFTIQNITSRNAVTDGWYVIASDPADHATYTKNGKWIACNALYNTRQGVSVINGSNLQFIGGSYSNTSGIAPQLGIDLEPNSTSSSTSGAYNNIVIQNVLFKDNAGGGVGCSNTYGVPGVTKISNCTFEGDGYSPLVANSPIVLTGSTFKNINSFNRGVIDLGSNAQDHSIINGNFFENCADPVNSNSRYLIYVQGAEYVSITNNTAISCDTFCVSYQDYTLIQGNTVKDTSLGNGFGNLANIQSGADKCSVIGNLSVGGSINAIYSFADHTTVHNNAVYECATGNNTYGAIRLRGNYVSAVGNRIFHTNNNTAVALVVGGSGQTVSDNMIFGYKPGGEITHTDIPVHVHNSPRLDSVLFDASDTTPDVIGKLICRTNNSSSTTITDFINGFEGQEIRIIVDGDTTIQNNANIQLDSSMNFAPASGGSISLLNDSGVWTELSRMTK